MKKFITIILATVLVLSLAGCKFVTYEDTNGDEDFSLQTLTEADITSNANICSQTMSTKSMINNVTTYTAKEMSGVIKLYETSLQNQDFEIQLSSEVSKGNARLVLVIANTIVHDFMLNEKEQTFSIKNFSGKIRLKLAGESAEYKITYTIN